jgi:hypothetical protein
MIHSDLESFVRLNHPEDSVVEIVSYYPWLGTSLVFLKASLLMRDKVSVPHTSIIRCLIAVIPPEVFALKYTF